LRRTLGAAEADVRECSEPVAVGLRQLDLEPSRRRETRGIPLRSTRADVAGHRAYVLSSSSFLANNTLDVEFDHGLLKKFTLEADSSAVAAAVVESAGNVTKARIDAETEVSTKPSRRRRKRRALTKRRRP
jgi:hypothetical protein